METRQIQDLGRYRLHRHERCYISLVVLSRFTISGPPLLLTKDPANFLNFLAKVRVPAVPTPMTFGVSRDHGIFEWAGTSLDAIFCQRGNLFSPRMWRMVFDIIRFNQFALDVLIADDPDARPSAASSRRRGSIDPDETIGQYLQRERYSNAFRDDYLIPMTAAVWSTSPDKCSLEFPALTLIRFL